MRLIFKSHSQSVREYSVTGDSGPLHFIKAALTANGWIVVRVEDE